MEQYGETSSFTAHNITKARFLQPIRFHHSFNDPLIILPYNQSPECFLPELDRLEVIYLYERCDDRHYGLQNSISSTYPTACRAWRRHRPLGNIAGVCLPEAGRPDPQGLLLLRENHNLWMGLHWSPHLGCFVSARPPSRWAKHIGSHLGDICASMCLRQRLLVQAP